MPHDELRRAKGKRSVREAPEVDDVGPLSLCDLEQPPPRPAEVVPGLLHPLEPERALLVHEPRDPVDGAALVRREPRPLRREHDRHPACSERSGELDGAREDAAAASATRSTFPTEGVGDADRELAAATTSPPFRTTRTSPAPPALHASYIRSSVACTSRILATSGSYRPPSASLLAHSTAARPPHASGGDASVSRRVPAVLSTTKS